MTRQDSRDTIQPKFTAVSLAVTQPYLTAQTDPVSGISALHSSGEYSVNLWMWREKHRRVNIKLLLSEFNQLNLPSSHAQLGTFFYISHAGLILYAILLASIKFCAETRLVEVHGSETMLIL